MKKLKFITVITSLIVLFACANMPNGSDYLGTWVDERRGDVIQISKQGKAYLIEGDAGMEGIYILTEENYLKGDFGIITVTAYIDKDSEKLVFSEYSDAGITKWTKIIPK